MRVLVSGDEKRKVVVNVFLSGLLAQYGDELYVVYRNNDSVGDITAEWVRANNMKRKAQNLEWVEEFDWELEEPDLTFFFGKYDYDLVTSLGDKPAFIVEKI